MQSNFTLDQAGNNTQFCHNILVVNFVANFFIQFKLIPCVSSNTHFYNKDDEHKNIRKTLFLSHEERAISKRSRVCTSFFFFFLALIFTKFNKYSHMYMHEFRYTIVPRDSK